MTSIFTPHGEDVEDICSKEELVTFEDVSHQYPPDNTVTVKYRLGSHVQTGASDWVGVFPERWHDVSQPLASVLTGDVGERRGAVAGTKKSRTQRRSVTFSQGHVENLKSNDQRYQFIYVDSSNQVLGVSSPFKITSSEGEADVDSGSESPVVLSLASDNDEGDWELASNSSSCSCKPGSLSPCWSPSSDLSDILREPATNQIGSPPGVQHEPIDSPCDSFASDLSIVVLSTSPSKEFSTRHQTDDLAVVPDISWSSDSDDGEGRDVSQLAAPTAAESPVIVPKNAGSKDKGECLRDDSLKVHKTSEKQKLSINLDTSGKSTNIVKKKKKSKGLSSRTGKADVQKEPAPMTCTLNARSDKVFKEPKQCRKAPFPINVRTTSPLTVSILEKGQTSSIIEKLKIIELDSNSDQDDNNICEKTIENTKPSALIIEIEEPSIQQKPTCTNELEKRLRGEKETNEKLNTLQKINTTPKPSPVKSTCKGPSKYTNNKSLTKKAKKKQKKNLKNVLPNDKEHVITDNQKCETQSPVGDKDLHLAPEYYQAQTYCGKDTLCDVSPLNVRGLVFDELLDFIPKDERMERGKKDAKPTQLDPSELRAKQKEDRRLERKAARSRARKTVTSWEVVPWKHAEGDNNVAPADRDTDGDNEDDDTADNRINAGAVRNGLDTELKEKVTKKKKAKLFKDNHQIESKTKKQFVTEQIVLPACSHFIGEVTENNEGTPSLKNTTDRNLARDHATGVCALQSDEMQDLKKKYVIKTSKKTKRSSSRSLSKIRSSHLESAFQFLFHTGSKASTGNNEVEKSDSLGLESFAKPAAASQQKFLAEDFPALSFTGEMLRLKTEGTKTGMCIVSEVTDNHDSLIKIKDGRDKDDGVDDDCEDVTALPYKGVPGVLHMMEALPPASASVDGRSLVEWRRAMLPMVPKHALPVLHNKYKAKFARKYEIRRMKMRRGSTLGRHSDIIDRIKTQMVVPKSLERIAKRLSQNEHPRKFETIHGKDKKKISGVTIFDSRPPTYSSIVKKDTDSGLGTIKASSIKDPTRGCNKNQTPETKPCLGLALVPVLACLSEEKKPTNQEAQCQYSTSCLASSSIVEGEKKKRVSSKFPEKFITYTPVLAPTASGLFQRPTKLNAVHTTQVKCDKEAVGANLIWPMPEFNSLLNTSPPPATTTFTSSSTLTPPNCRLFDTPSVHETNTHAVGVEVGKAPPHKPALYLCLPGKEKTSDIAVPAVNPQKVEEDDRSALMDMALTSCLADNAELRATVESLKRQMENVLMKNDEAQEAKVGDDEQQAEERPQTTRAHMLKCPEQRKLTPCKFSGKVTKLVRSHVEVISLSAKLRDSEQEVVSLTNQVNSLKEALQIETKRTTRALTKWFKLKLKVKVLRLKLREVKGDSGTMTHVTSVLADVPVTPPDLVPSSTGSKVSTKDKKDVSDADFEPPCKRQRLQERKKLDEGQCPDSAPPVLPHGLSIPGAYLMAPSLQRPLPPFSHLPQPVSACASKAPSLLDGYSYNPEMYPQNETELRSQRQPTEYQIGLDSSEEKNQLGWGLSQQSRVSTPVTSQLKFCNTSNATSSQHGSFHRKPYASHLVNKPSQRVNPYARYRSVSQRKRSPPHLPLPTPQHPPRSPSPRRYQDAGPPNAVAHGYKLSPSSLWFQHSPPVSRHSNQQPISSTNGKVNWLIPSNTPPVYPPAYSQEYAVPNAALTKSLPSPPPNPGSQYPQLSPFAYNPFVNAYQSCEAPFTATNTTGHCQNQQDNEAKRQTTIRDKRSSCHEDPERLVNSQTQGPLPVSPPVNLLASPPGRYRSNFMRNMIRGEVTQPSRGRNWYRLFYPPSATVPQTQDPYSQQNPLSIFPPFQSPPLFWYDQTAPPPSVDAKATPSLSSPQLVPEGACPEMFRTVPQFMELSADGVVDATRLEATVLPVNDRSDDNISNNRNTIDNFYDGGDSTSAHLFRIPLFSFNRPIESSTAFCTRQ